MVYKVENIEEAYKLAKKFKNEGKYQWFRGQAKNWPVRSSFSRLSNTKRKLEIEKLKRFIEWITFTEETKHLSKNIDWCIAIAQHYGIATNFIDFTTEPKVACFFATRKKWFRKNWISSIVCLNIHEVNNILKLLVHRNNLPEILDFSIKDLWRHQSQKGKFLFAPIVMLEKFYDFDRINFPFSKTFEHLDEQEVFPVRKSPLENVIESYFENEKIIRFHKYAEDWNIKVHHLPNVDESYRVLKKVPHIHKSWDKPKLKKWELYTKLSYSSVKNICCIKLTIDYTHELKKMYAVIRNDITYSLIKVKNLKNKFISWEISINGFKKINTSYLDIYWDGVKYFPYHIKDIAIGLTNCILLQFYQDPIKILDEEKLENFLYELWGEILFIEFSNLHSSSRAFVSYKEIRNAVRQDIHKYLLSPGILENNLLAFLMCFNKPQYIFDFYKISKLFAQQIIPTQIIYRSGLGPIIYSPHKLEILGIP